MGVKKRLKKLIKEGVGSIMEIKKGELFIVSDLDVSMDGDRKVVIDDIKKALRVLSEGNVEKYANKPTKEADKLAAELAMNSPEASNMFDSFISELKAEVGFEMTAEQQKEIKDLVKDSLVNGVSKNETFVTVVGKINGMYRDAVLAGKVGTVGAAPVQGELNFAKELGCDTCENREECDRQEAAAQPQPENGNQTTEEERELSEIEAYRKRRRELRADVREMLNEVLGEGNYSFSLTRKFGKEEEEAQMEQAAGAMIAMQ